jgi:hypothetical protein
MNIRSNGFALVIASHMIPQEWQLAAVKRAYICQRNAVIP